MQSHLEKLQKLQEKARGKKCEIQVNGILGKSHHYSECHYNSNLVYILR